MLALPGFIEAKYFDPVRDSEAGGWIHTVQYTLANRAALDNYLENDAERMRQDGIDRFGDALEASRSIRELVAANDEARCLNCDASLQGQYCWNCGQRGNTRLISLFELLRDAFGDMFELDSRLWRTLIPLSVRPGVLTDEYLRGRRARYMPPFRMYLVLSFVFFLLASTMSDGVNVQIDGVDVENEVRQGIADGFASGDVDALAAQLEAAGVDPERAIETARRAASADPEARRAMAAAAEEGFDCEDINIGSTGVDWLDGMFSKERATRVCEEVREDRGRRFLERWGENAPVAALAVLPLMALLLKAMYPLSRRYYVEHLLMLVHFHSFLFLLLSLGLGFNALAELGSLPEPLVVTVNVAGWAYVPVYLYRSIRKVYGQGRLASLFKFLVMLSGYLAATVLVIVLTLLYVVATY